MDRQLGFDVPGLIRRLEGHRVAYHAHSSGYGFDLPPGIAVLAVSRNTLGYWGDRAPRNPLFLVPNALEQAWLDRGDRADASGRERPIDVLVQARKSSEYVLQRLVPALRQRGLSVGAERLGGRFGGVVQQRQGVSLRLSRVLARTGCIGRLRTSPVGGDGLRLCCVHEPESCTGRPL